MRRGDAIEFEKCAAANGDLAVVRIGEGQAPIEIAIERHAVLAIERDLPRLGVVRIGREDRVRQRKAARIGLARTGIAPPGDGVRPPRAA